MIEMNFRWASSFYHGWIQSYFLTFYFQVSAYITSAIHGQFSPCCSEKFEINVDSTIHHHNLNHISCLTMPRLLFTIASKASGDQTRSRTITSNTPRLTLTSKQKLIDHHQFTKSRAWRHVHEFLRNFGQILSLIFKIFSGFGCTN